jgi:hypothetical protein
VRPALAAALLLAVTAAPAAAAPVGAPERIGIPRAADHAEHPGALSEWWTLRLVDPRSAGWVEIRAERHEGEPASVAMTAYDGSGAGFADAFNPERLAATRDRLDATWSDHSLAIRRRGRSVRFRADGARADLRLRATRPGPAAYGWRLAAAYDPVTLNWGMPVASGVARGAVRAADGRRIPMDGWRASYEHAWGDIADFEPRRDFWDQVVVHDRGGVAWAAYGLNRRDTVTGPGARDAQWLGVLARVGRDGRVRTCRPRVRRSAWQVTNRAARWATRLIFACGGMRLRVRDGEPTVSDLGYTTEIRSRHRGRTGFSLHVAANHF